LSCWKFSTQTQNEQLKLFTARAEDDDLEGLQENPRSRAAKRFFDVIKIVLQFFERVGD